eukprot:Gb_25275 [translate_table: standard]
MEEEARLDSDQWGNFEQSMKEHPELKLLSVIAERDAAILERNAALAEKKAAYAERDAALLQRDVAYADRNTALMERDAAVAALEYTKNGSLNGPRNPSCGTVVSTKIIQVLAENPTFGLREYQNVQPVTAAFPSPILENPLTEQQPEKKTKQTSKKNEGQKQSPSKRKSDGSAPKTQRHRKPRKQAIVTGEESNRQLVVVKHEWKDQDYENSGITIDTSTMPIPACSCTGVLQHCYRWGNGGWQSACCTTYISMYPLPMNPKKRGARVPGRKMSGGAFRKLLMRLTAEGHDLSYPIDLKTHWARHGTNRPVEGVPILFQDIVDGSEILVEAVDALSLGMMLNRMLILMNILISGPLYLP